MSTIPVPAIGAWTSLDRLRAWFPWVGLLVGAIGGAAFLGAAALLPPACAAVVATGSWLLLTGGLHLDGVADCGDGLGCQASRERRLEIMKDPRVGAFGVCALVLVLLGRFAAFLSIVAVAVPPGWHASLRLLAACAFAAASGRFMVLLVGMLPYARPAGMGAGLSAPLSFSRWLLALVPVVATGACVGMLPALAGLGAALCGSALLACVSMRRLGGVTGDVAGATVEISEVLVLMVVPQLLS